ncbi:complement C1q tumor necrosis factor-related protein 3-like isoform X1 [Mya arenaria]|uniref:complement C1q tumor necrosis factor-related protein 3-like isoform X1 n=1 Tax=Mya arenaria TaxID=6604 RepID=UPI0022E70D3B|nr:complement C1q tumor necrosis factor-related protein 3-like isoform X1 [Mya arenaria]
MHLKKTIKYIESQHTTTRNRHAIPDIDIGNKFARQAGKRQAGNGPTAFTSCVGVKDLTNLGAHQTIIFDRIITNYGQAYRNSTGIFHAPINGVYAFHLSAMSRPNHSLYLNFVHDGVIIDGIYSSAQGITEVESVGEMWTLEMKQGSEVWIASSGQGEIHGYCHTMFSGFLLFETEPTNIIG